MVSCIVPCLNENIDELKAAIANLTYGITPYDLEVVIVNDGSVNDDGSQKFINYYDIPYPNLQIINNKERFGVGYAFDRGVFKAKGGTIVLMGADVRPEPVRWLNSVKKALNDREIGCCCSVGMQRGTQEVNPDHLYSRYGAEILFTLTVDDLPKNSELRKDPNYKDILEAKWLPAQPYEIPCPYGAFYWMTREFYEGFHGFDTVEGEHLLGHCFWGALEPFLGLKARVYGGKTMMYPDIRVGHVFSRVDYANLRRSIRNDLKFFNKLWIAHTMLDDELRDECLNHLNPCLNLSQAQVWVKQRWNVIQETRQRNIKEGKLISKPYN